MNNLTIIFLSLLMLLSVASSADAQPTEQQLTPNDALEMAMQKNPRMKIAIDELRQADLLVEQEGARYVPVWSSAAEYQYGKTSNLTSAGLVYGTRNALVFSTGLSHTLPIGTQLSVDLEFSRSMRDDPIDETVGGYNTGLNFQVIQPLLRGFGTDTGLAARASARIARTSAEAAKLETASDLTMDVLTAYWSLWSAQRQLEIELESLDVTQKELDSAEAKLKVGTLAPAEVVSIRIAVAQSRESVAEARRNVKQQTLILAELIGASADAVLAVQTVAPIVGEIPVASAAVETAKQNAYQLTQSRNRISLATISHDLAKDAALPSLDATAGFSIAGLSDEPGEAFGELVGLEAYVATVGLRFELPIVNRAKRAEAERAEVGISIAQSEYDQAERALVSRITSLVTDLETAKERLELARETAKLAQENVDAQTARFGVGRSTSLEVVDALRSLREAEFRAVQIEVEIANGEIELRNETGTLL